MRDLSVYIHIPFCIRKCRYCDFLSYPASEKEREEYVRLLIREIEKQSLLYKEHRVITVFLGGGTPSLLNIMETETIIKTLKHNLTFTENPEITIETNPGTVTADKLEAWLGAGINRLSIGLQSADDEELKTLGRIHDYRTFCRMYDMARKAGFRNINVDIMAAIPGQTRRSYTETLKKVLSFAPEHISAYSLMIEEGTWFYEHRNELSFPTEEEDRQLYDLTGEMLAKYGYMRYEISNYAKAGYECRHNKVYWNRGDYVGFGLGASSMVEEIRWKNGCDFKEYRRALLASEADLPASRTAFAKQEASLSVKEQMEEFMFLGLRLIKGVSKRRFADTFGCSLQSVYGETVRELKENALLEEDTEYIRLTPYGIDISNYVMSMFLLSC